MILSSQKLLEEIRLSPGQKVKVAVTDLDGVLRGKYLNKEKFFAAASEGFGFCNVIFGWDSADACYDNSKYTGWHTGYPDVTAKIDLSTYRKVPWENRLPFLGRLRVSSGPGFGYLPALTLKKVLARTDKAGFKASCGMEFEWFNFKETAQSFADKKFVAPTSLSPGMFGYSLLRSSQNQPFFAAMMDELGAFGVPIEGLHTETGPGVFEAAILYCDALQAADRAVLFKMGVKEIGHRFGIMPSFMAKWNASLPGCSGHIHQSLWRGADNVFYDAKAPHKMSAIFKNYLAGQLHCLPEFLPLFAPNVNSYKRLVEGYWAPTKATWGVDNRTTACRVIPGSAKSTRLETRVPGSDVNPYLCIAASLASGLYGIEKSLTLEQAPTVGSAYEDRHTPRFPTNLVEATQKFADSKIANEVFGEGFVDHFSKSRIWEWRQFQNSVTNWELQRYFEII